MHQLTIKLPARPSVCSITVGRGLLYSNLLISTLKATGASRFAIITDTTVEALHARRLAAFLQAQGLSASLIVFPSGEENKTRARKEECEDQLLNLGFGRDSCLIGIGGGVVTDMAGFIASTYCRGVALLQIPTTLLAMVDASIGGKTGLNVPQGKNLIGSFYHPEAILIDTELLQTLPLAEVKHGLAEMIKHGLIADPNYFDWMSRSAKQLLELDLPLMEEAIATSIKIKAHIVQQDPTEKGERRLLNFGHTVAHAIESATDYQVAHGQAVAIGMVAESYLAREKGHLASSDFERIGEVLSQYQIDLSFKGSLAPEKLRASMLLDKKAVNQQPRFVLLEAIGKPLHCLGDYCSAVDELLLQKTLKWTCQNVMRCY